MEKRSHGLIFDDANHFGLPRAILTGFELKCFLHRKKSSRDSGCFLSDLKDRYCLLCSALTALDSSAPALGSI
jgi:hypothetical protein